MQTVLILAEAQSYMVLSMKEKLEEAGYQVLISTVDMEAVSSIQENIHTILIYSDEDMLRTQQGLIYIKDKATEGDIPIYLVGNGEELAAIQSFIPKHLVQKAYVRPFNIAEVVKDLDTYMKDNLGGAKKKILVVDDSGAMLRNVKGWLEDKYQVILANSGAMAIKYLAMNRPDLVLLDYEMPVVDGSQVFEMIRTEVEFTNIPVIFLTSKDDKQSVMKVMSLKPDGYLLKTMEPAKIVQAVDEFFMKQKALQQSGTGI